jgi:hypothetical protein
MAKPGVGTSGADPPRPAQERENPMQRNLKILGLALIAVFAITALSASAANAAKFTATSYPAILTFETDEQRVFTLGGTEITCRVPVSQITISAAVEELSWTPVYEECKTKLGEISVTIKGFADNKNCDWVFKTKEEKLDLECKVNTVVEVLIGGFCKITIPTQTNRGTAIYTAKGSAGKEELTIDETAKELQYTIDEVSFCKVHLDGSHEPGKTYEDGKYSGSSTVKAYKDESGKEGAQIGVLVD